MQNDVHPSSKAVTAQTLQLQLRLWALNGADATTSWPWLSLSYGSLFLDKESQIRNSETFDLEKTPEIIQSFLQLYRRVN